MTQEDVCNLVGRIVIEAESKTDVRTGYLSDPKPGTPEHLLRRIYLAAKNVAGEEGRERAELERLKAKYGDGR